MHAKNFAKGCLVSICYIACFLVLRNNSVDQWYLPAGLRLVTLLFVPARFWPYLFFGDAAAVLSLRLPLVESRGYPIGWAYISSLFFFPIVSLIPIVARSNFPKITENDNQLLVLGALTALWGSSCSLALNALLGGPGISSLQHEIVKDASGDYLGILMVMLPVMIWKRRNQAHSFHHNLIRDGVASILGIMAVFVAVRFVDDPLLRQLLLLTMIAPIIALTFRHGWMGSAIGVVIVNAAIAFAMPNEDIPGSFHADTLSVQLLFGTCATCFLCLGAKISEIQSRVVPQDDRGEKQLELTKAWFSRSERNLRSYVVEYNELNRLNHGWWRDVASYLRSHGHAAVAMEVTCKGMMQNQMFEAHISSLYPLEIETSGLFHVIRSWKGTRASSADLHYRLSGDPRQLSVDLQLVAYRCLLDAIQILPEASTHIVKAKTWKAKTRQGIMISVVADVSFLDAVLKPAPDRMTDFSERVRTHGGTYKRRHALSFSFLVSEEVPRSSSLPLEADTPMVSIGKLVNSYSDPGSLIN